MTTPSFEDTLRTIIREELRMLVSEMRSERPPDFAREMSLAETARVAGRSVRTVREWIRAGMLPSTQIAPGGPRTVNQADLEQFLRNHRGGTPCPKPDPRHVPPPGKTAGRRLRVAQ